MKLFQFSIYARHEMMKLKILNYEKYVLIINRMIFFFILLYFLLSAWIILYHHDLILVESRENVS